VDFETENEYEHVANINIFKFHEYLRTLNCQRILNLIFVGSLMHIQRTSGVTVKILSIKNWTVIGTVTV